MLFLIPAMTIALAPLRVYVLDGGHAILNDSSLLSDIGEAGGKPVELTNPCFLIRHGSRWLMWDTGFADSYVGHPFTSPAARIWKAETMPAQLRRLGLTARNVAFVALSHPHFDHAGCFGQFGASTWIVERKDLAYGQLTPPRISVDPILLRRPKGAKLKVIDGDYDVFGDGTVRILTTPGHTPGHACLLIRLPKTGPILLSGDAFPTRANFDHDWVPSINENRSESLASMSRIKSLCKTLGARLIIQHAPEDIRTLPRILD